MVYAERNAELFEEMMHAAWGSHVGWYSGSTRTQDIFQHTVEVYLEQLLNGTVSFGTAKTLVVADQDGSSTDNIHI